MHPKCVSTVRNLDAEGQVRICFDFIEDPLMEACDFESSTLMMPDFNLGDYFSIDVGSIYEFHNQTLSMINSTYGRERSIRIFTGPTDRVQFSSVVLLGCHLIICGTSLEEVGSLLSTFKHLTRRFTINGLSCFDFWSALYRSKQLQLLKFGDDSSGESQNSMHVEEFLHYARCLLHTSNKFNHAFKYRQLPSPSCNTTISSLEDAEEPAENNPAPAQRRKRRGPPRSPRPPAALPLPAPRPPAGPALGRRRPRRARRRGSSPPAPLPLPGCRWSVVAS